MTLFVHATAEVSEQAHIGNGTTIWNWTKVREGVHIGPQCNIGQGVYIDEGVRVGSACKIQNYVSIYRGVTIGDGVFVGPHATFTNDLSPRADSLEWAIVPTIVDDGASIGANATIVCGVRLGRRCMVGAGAVVTSDVAPYSLVTGVPARFSGWVDDLGRRVNEPPASA